MTEQVKQAEAKTETAATAATEDKSFPWIPVTISVVAGIAVGAGATALVMGNSRKKERAEHAAQLAALKAPEL